MSFLTRLIFISHNLKPANASTMFSALLLANRREGGERIPLVRESLVSQLQKVRYFKQLLFLCGSQLTIHLQQYCDMMTSYLSQ